MKPLVKIFRQLFARTGIAIVTGIVTRFSLHLFRIVPKITAAMRGIMTAVADDNAVSGVTIAFRHGVPDMMRLCPFAKCVVSRSRFANPVNDGGTGRAPEILPDQRLPFDCRCKLNTLCHLAFLSVQQGLNRASLGFCMSPRRNNSTSWFTRDPQIEIVIALCRFKLAIPFLLFVLVLAMTGLIVILLVNRVVFLRDFLCF